MSSSGGSFRTSARRFQKGASWSSSLEFVHSSPASNGTEHFSPPCEAHQGEIKSVSLQTPGAKTAVSPFKVKRRGWSLSLFLGG
jgi:hypothetical protein